jgi:hypothetical protein
VHVPAAAPAPAAQQQVVEQQIAQTRQVILVPQQVYVPFVQSTNFGAVRVSGLQQTQFLNAQGLLTTAAAGTATGQAVGAAGQLGVGTQAAGTTAAGQAISPEDARRCQEELRTYKAVVSELSGQIQRLQAEVQSLQGKPPSAIIPPTDKSP